MDKCQIFVKYNPGKIWFWAISSYFWHKNLKTRFPPTKVILNQYNKVICNYNFMQKIRKVLKDSFSSRLKNFILDPFWPLLAWKPRNQIFPQKIIPANFKKLCCCMLMQKTKKIPCINFSYNLNNLNLGPFWTLFIQKAQKSFFQKNPAQSLCKLDDNLTLHKINQVSTSGFKENLWTNRQQTDVQR